MGGPSGAARPAAPPRTSKQTNAGSGVKVVYAVCMGLGYLFSLVVALGVLLRHRLVVAPGTWRSRPRTRRPWARCRGRRRRGRVLDPVPLAPLLDLRRPGLRPQRIADARLRLAHPLVGLVVAVLAGLCSPASSPPRPPHGEAWLSQTTESRSSLAVGKVARVVVPCGARATGGGVVVGGAASILMATTDDPEIAHGGVRRLVEDIHDGVAHVCGAALPSWGKLRPVTRRFDERPAAARDDEPLPACKNAVPARVVARDGEVWMEKACPEHGTQEARALRRRRLVRAHARHPTPPAPARAPAKEVEHGCPFDCGACAHARAEGAPAGRDHHQRVQPRLPHLLRPQQERGRRSTWALEELRADPRAPGGGQRRRAGPRQLHRRRAHGAPALPRVPRACARRRHPPRHHLHQRHPARAGRGPGRGGSPRSARASRSRSTRSRRDADHALQGAHLRRPQAALPGAAREARRRHDAHPGDDPRRERPRDRPHHPAPPCAEPQRAPRRGPHHDLHRPGRRQPSTARARISMYEVLRAHRGATTGGLLRADDFVPSPCAHPLCYQIAYLLLDPDGGAPVPFTRFLDRETFYESPRPSACTSSPRRASRRRCARPSTASGRRRARTPSAPCGILKRLLGGDVPDRRRGSAAKALRGVGAAHQGHLRPLAHGRGDLRHRARSSQCCDMQLLRRRHDHPGVRLQRALPREGGALHAAAPAGTSAAAVQAPCLR